MEGDLMLGLLLSLVAGPEGGAQFVARALEVGGEIVVTRCGSPAKDFILEVNGGGLVAEDFDGDGHLDLVVVDGSDMEGARAGRAGRPTRLFLGDGAGGFAAAGKAWAMSGGRWAMAGCAGDLNGDGFPDLFLTEWGRNRLYLNDGGRGFVDASLGVLGADGELKPSGLDGERWSTSACLFDYDGDGHLDIAVVNYLGFHLDELRGPGGGCTWKGFDVMCGPEGMIPVHDQILRGAGDGTFRDVSIEIGFHPEAACFGLGVVSLDYDGDGDSDLYISNDSMPNHLWENTGDGHFKEVGMRRGVSHDANGKEQAGMGIACADVDGDGREDLFVTNFSGERNAFYRSSRATGFRERADVSRLGGVSIGRLGWGTALADFDLDGDLDLVVANGHVYPQADRAGTDTSYAQEDQFFRNDGTGRFTEEPLSGHGAGVSRALLAADWDEDGDLDLALIQLDGAVLMLENQAPHGPQNHWLEVRLKGRGGNRFGVGARVALESPGGAQFAEMRTSAGYQAGCAAWLHFGLGTLEELQALVVRWPSGRVQRIEAPALDQRLVIWEAGE